MLQTCVPGEQLRWRTFVLADCGSLVLVLLVFERDQWPVTRDFVRTDLPVEEIKSTGRIVTACLRSEAIATFATAMSTDIGEPEVMHQKFLEQFEKVLLFDNEM